MALSVCMHIQFSSEVNYILLLLFGKPILSKPSHSVLSLFHTYLRCSLIVFPLFHFTASIPCNHRIAIFLVCELHRVYVRCLRSFGTSLSQTFIGTDVRAIGLSCKISQVSCKISQVS